MRLVLIWFMVVAVVTNLGVPCTSVGLGHPTNSRCHLVNLANHALVFTGLGVSTSKDIGQAPYRRLDQRSVLRDIGVSSWTVSAPDLGCWSIQIILQYRRGLHKRHLLPRQLTKPHLS